MFKCLLIFVSSIICFSTSFLVSWYTSSNVVEIFFLDGNFNAGLIYFLESDNGNPHWKINLANNFSFSICSTDDMSTKLFIVLWLLDEPDVTIGYEVIVVFGVVLLEVMLSFVYIIVFESSKFSPE